jgi:hypothetical protein
MQIVWLPGRYIRPERGPGRQEGQLPAIRTQCSVRTRFVLQPCELETSAQEFAHSLTTQAIDYRNRLQVIEQNCLA